MTEPKAVWFDDATPVIRDAADWITNKRMGRFRVPPIDSEWDAELKRVKEDMKRFAEGYYRKK